MTLNVSKFQEAYAQYWDVVKDIVDEEGGGGILKKYRIC